MSRPNFEHCPEAIQVDAVDRSKFRTCDQGSFCRRPGGDVMTPGAGHQDTKYGTDGLWTAQVQEMDQQTRKGEGSLDSSSTDQDHSG